MLHAQRAILLFRLRPLDPHPQKRLSEIQAFNGFWKKKLNLAHVACHAVAEVSPSDSYIELSKGFCISLQDMTVYKLQINNAPLIVLNGCHTGNIDPLYVSNIAGKFIESGARGVIATECAVPDELAAEFTEQLYIRLLSGEELGASLITARWHLLKNGSSPPTGLMYALYAPPHFRLSKE